MVAAAVCAAAPATTTAAAFRPVADDVGGIALADGGRWAAHVTVDGALRVLDDRAGTSRTLESPCATPGLALLAIGGGVAVIGCRDDRGIGDKPILLGLATGRWRQIAGIDGLWARYGTDPTDGVRFPDVGRRWLHVTASGQQLDDDFWLDWRTGVTSAERRPGTLYDDDSVDLVKPSCETRGFLPVSGDGQLALGFSGDRLAVRRCDRRGVVRIDEGSVLVSRQQLAGGVVSWHANVDRLFLPRCGVRLTWPQTTTSSWTHTARSLWRVVEGTLERAPLPACADAVGVAVGSGGRAVAARSVAGVWPSVAGSEAELLARGDGSPPTLTVAAGATIAIRTAQPAASVRWRLGGGRWQRATGASRGWRFTAPLHLPGTRALRLAIRYDGSWSTRAEVALRRR